jgi:Bacterial protein of unknown function (DUF882)
MLAARAMQRGGVGWYPHSGFLHIDTGPVRNWHLDENGLGSLLFDGQRLRFNDKERSATRVRSGHFLPEMEPSGRSLPGILPDMTRGRRPLYEVAVAAKRERLAERGPLRGFMGTVSMAIDLIGQYQDAGVHLLINSDYRNDIETHELFASDIIPHFA